MDGEPSSWGKRAVWFVALWLGGVLVTGAVATIIRFWLHAA